MLAYSSWENSNFLPVSPYTVVYLWWRKAKHPLPQEHTVLEGQQCSLALIGLGITGKATNLHFVAFSFCLYYFILTLKGSFNKNPK